MKISRQDRFTAYTIFKDREYPVRKVHVKDGKDWLGTFVSNIALMDAIEQAEQSASPKDFNEAMSLSEEILCFIEDAQLYLPMNQLARTVKDTTGLEIEEP